MTFPLTNHPCPNCQFLYERIKRADRLAAAFEPYVNAWRIVGVAPNAVSAFDLYVADTLDARIAAARDADPAPETQRSGAVDMDEVVERSR